MSAASVLPQMYKIASLPNSSFYQQNKRITSGDGRGGGDGGDFSVLCKLIKQIIIPKYQFKEKYFSLGHPVQ